MLALLAWPGGDVVAANYKLEIEAPKALVEPIRNQTLLGRWIDEPDFQPAQLPLFVERGREEVAAIVRDAGYFSASVEMTIIEPGHAAASEAAASTSEGSLPTVRIDVDAGARTTVAAFDLQIEGPPAARDERARLLADWPLPEGSFFQPSIWEQGKRLMLDLLQQHGFVRARFEASEARVDPRTTAASLSLRIATGEQMPFGETTIRGLERYDRSIVEALRPWRAASPSQPAEAYDFDDLLQFQSRLRDAGYFSSVDVLPDLAAIEADPKLRSVPIVVVLRERKRQRISGGVGYSTDDGPRLLLGYDNRDFLGRNLLLESGVLVESVRRRVFASVRTPQDASGHFNQVGARAERLDVQNELTDRQTLLIGRGKHAEEIDSFTSLQFQTEQRTVPLDPATDQRHALTLGKVWNLRRVDSRIDPRNGYTISAQVSGAAKALVSDRSFLRLWARSMHFWPIPLDSGLGDGLLIGVLEAGQVFAGASNGIPTENLFRTGGAQSIRGYSYLSLGVNEDGAVVGGRVMALASLEYQHPVVRDWYGAVFLDAGNAADTWSTWDAVYAPGVGVRWRSPVGPVNLDLAWGRAVHEWRLHLTVGYAF